MRSLCDVNTHQDVAFAEAEMMEAFLNGPGGLLANVTGGEAVSGWEWYVIYRDLIPNLDNTNSLPTRPIDPQVLQRLQEAAKEAARRLREKFEGQESDLQYERGKAMSHYNDLVAQKRRLAAQIQNDQSELSNRMTNSIACTGGSRGSAAGLRIRRTPSQAIKPCRPSKSRPFRRSSGRLPGIPARRAFSPTRAVRMQPPVAGRRKPAIEYAIAAFRSLGINGPALDALIQTDESITVDNAVQKLQALAQTLTGQLGLLQASQGARAAR